MNPHEHTYRRSGRWLLVTGLLWIAVLVCFAIFPPKGENYERESSLYACLFVTLFVALVVVSVIRIVAYIRWTGKYPYYFLFRKSTKSDEER